MGETLGQRMNKLMDDHFVGREFEQHVFTTMLQGLEERSERILNLHGTAGIGKTFLLNRFGKLAERVGTRAAYVDAKEAFGSEEVFCGLLLQALGESTEIPDIPACINAINDKAREQKVVLLIDGFETMGSLDHQIREKLLPGLDANVLTVIAGRHSLEGPWRRSAVWSSIVVKLPLKELDYEVVRGYLCQRGVTDERQLDEIWLRTLGHPLSLNLSLDGSRGETVLSRDMAANPEPPEECVRQWLGEAPDNALRELLYAASVPRSFHQEQLGELLGRSVSDAEFDRLIGLSFTNRTPRGWQLTELVWETLRASFKTRMPSRFAEYADKTIAHYNRLLDQAHTGRGKGWEIDQLMRFSSSPVLRAHLRHSRDCGHYLEPIDSANYVDAETYIEERLRTAKPQRIRCSDPQTGALFRFEMSAEESLLRLSALPLNELLRTGPDSVRLVRSKEGNVLGLFAIVPIHGGTAAFLRSAPLSRMYFETRETILSEGSERYPAGWFVYAMDVVDLEDESLRSAIVQAIFEKIAEGGLVLQSPPPLAYFRYACEGLGFECADVPSHPAYGESYPAYVYEIDTRGNRLKDYLRKMVPQRGALIEGHNADAGAVAKAEAAEEIPRTIEAIMAALTPREKEVASLLTQGLSNSDIAAALFVSEAAVKKHVNAMLSKYGLKNRTQLARAILDGRSPYE